MSEERKSIKAGKLVNKNPDKRLLLTIKEQSVKTEHIADNAITPQKVSSDAVQYITADVQNQIDSIQIGGWAISNQLGNDPHIGISQKTLTDLIGYENVPETIRGRIQKIEDEIGSDTTSDTLSGRIKNIEEEIGTDTTSQTLSRRITSLEGAVGTGGSVDERIAQSKSEVVGNATVPYNTLGKVESRIQEETTARMNAVGAETSRAQAAESALNTKIDNSVTNINAKIGEDVTTERNRALGAEELLRQAYEAVSQFEPIVGTLPSSGISGKVYRVPGTTSYSDYMWDGTRFVKMAEYNNAIDDEPIENSGNIISSKGVASIIGRPSETNYALGVSDNHGHMLFGIDEKNIWDIVTNGIRINYGKEISTKDVTVYGINADPYVLAVTDKYDHLLLGVNESKGIEIIDNDVTDDTATEIFNRNKDTIRDIYSVTFAHANPKSEAEKKMQVMLMTDTHRLPTYNYCMELANKMISADCILHLGDIVYDNSGPLANDLLPSIELALKNEKPVYITFGNHDVGASPSPNNVYSTKWLYDNYIVPMIAKGRIKAENAVINNTCYFVDYNKGGSKTRLIFLNQFDGSFTFDETYWETVNYDSSYPIIETKQYSTNDVVSIKKYTDHSFRAKVGIDLTTNPDRVPKIKEKRWSCWYSKAQLDWFADAMADAANNGFDVMILTHERPIPTTSLIRNYDNPWDNNEISSGGSHLTRFTDETVNVIKDIVDAVLDKTTVSMHLAAQSSADDDTSSEPEFDISYDFSTLEGTPRIIFLHGHNHKDVVMADGEHDYSVVGIAATKNQLQVTAAVNERNNTGLIYPFSDNYNTITKVGNNFLITRIGCSLTDKIVNGKLIDKRNNIF